MDCLWHPYRCLDDWILSPWHLAQYHGVPWSHTSIIIRRYLDILRSLHVHFYSNSKVRISTVSFGRTASAVSKSNPIIQNRYAQKYGWHFSTYKYILVLVFVTKPFVSKEKRSKQFHIDWWLMFNIQIKSKKVKHRNQKLPRIAGFKPYYFIWRSAYIVLNPLDVILSNRTNQFKTFSSAAQLYLFVYLFRTTQPQPLHSMPTRSEIPKHYVVYNCNATNGQSAQASSSISSLSNSTPSPPLPFHHRLNYPAYTIWCFPIWIDRLCCLVLKCRSIRFWFKHYIYFKRQPNPYHTRTAPQCQSANY